MIFVKIEGSLLVICPLWYHESRMRNIAAPLSISDVPLAVRTELAAYSLELQVLLFQRGITTKHSAEQFLAPSYEQELHDPLLLHDMARATSRIHHAIDNQEQIAIYSDYDCDGIPGAVVLHDYFTAIQYQPFTNYIPHRHYEGFGLSSAAVEKLAADGVKLIITIDCGTTDVEAVARANELGVDVIITDHHEPGETLPAAVAVVNPKLGTYPFRELCGAAVAFKLAQALLATGSHSVPPGQEKWWLDMVGLATIADMVPLVEENRVFATYGLMVLRKSRRPGLQQLIRKARGNQAKLTEDDIGFTIGPRINAASRMDAPEQAFALLTTTDEGVAGAQAAALEKLNTERKTAVASITRELHHWVESLAELPAVLVHGNPEWRPALVGLAANSLAQELSRPVFLWGRDGNSVYKGSCRSGGGVSVVTLMQQARAVFMEHGGHHKSGGFSLRDEHIHEVSHALNQAFVTLGAAAHVVEDIQVDAVLPLEAVFGPLRRDLARLAPFGVGNPKPIFAFEQVVPREVTMFGKGQEHLKLVFATGSGTLEAIAFFAADTSFSTEPKVGEPCNLLAHVEESYFMGRHQTRLRIVEIAR